MNKNKAFAGSITEIFGGIDMRIELNGIVKKFKQNTVLSNIELTVESGKTYCLLGASGSGKTTLLRIIMGALEADQGSVTIDGICVPNKDLLSKIGFMPQQDALYNELTIMQNLRFFAGIQKMRREEFMRNAKEVLDIVGLKQEKDKLVGKCSGGMKKRVSLAATLIHRPKLLILDEPTVGIDPVLRKRIWEYLHKLQADGLTILVTTHVMDEVSECNDAALLRNGRIIMHDSVENLIGMTTNGKIEELFFLDDKEESTCLQ